MNWMNKLEQKFGKYTIRSIYKYFIFAIFIGYVIGYIAPNVLDFLIFSPYHIFHGQVWRLVTWVFTAPSIGNPLFFLIFMLCLFSMGPALETVYGSFRINIYFITGILLCDIGGLLVYLLFGLPMYLSMYYILWFMFLILEVAMPEAEARLYFVLPIKMKWMLIFHIAISVYDIISCFRQGIAFGYWPIGFMLAGQIIFPLLNVGLFFLLSKNRISRKHKKRQKEFHAQFATPRLGSGITKHKCTICGRTELDDPNLSFRYCSKCTGSHEYCQEHLFTHTHIRPM